MPAGRPLQPVHLSPEEAEQLKQLARRPKSAQALALRARIVLACASGLSNTPVAGKLHVSRPTEGKWRERFRLHGLAGLQDEPRPGAPRSIRDEQVERVVRATLETLPEQGTHWTTRQMAKKMGLSETAIVRIWRAFGLQPHRVESFELSSDPLFVEKVRDIVGLYLHPPGRAVVLCVDEKSQVQAIERTPPILPLAPGLPARQTHDDRRHGVTSLFAALDGASGVVISDCYRRHRHQEFLRFLRRVDQRARQDCPRPDSKVDEAAVSRTDSPFSNRIHRLVGTAWAEPCRAPPSKSGARFLPLRFRESGAAGAGGSFDGQR